MNNAPYPTDPNGDMVPILEASLEAAMARHPSAQPPPTTPDVILNAHDRCDHCGAAAVYRVTSPNATEFDFCLHYWRKNFPAMADQGWVVIGGNPGLLAEMAAT
ncbi:hypothetical protein ACFWPU_00575 [Streptomyces sp. NPDC058471]|uniref:DUF7455 domain-containing protein n=1 Tax=Streptomyces sp. NPDC058471 TaxID=3346516 RepID=UPI003652FA3E